MKSSVVADTSGFVSLASITDSNHKIAALGSVSMQEQNLSLIVPGEVITETINVLGKKISHDIAIQVGKSILDSSSFTVVDTTTDIRKVAFAKFQKQASSVSFSDCLVMAVADAYGTKYIFGYDAIFRKKGYVRFGIDDQKK